jgi:hypothetical protein
VRRWPEGVGPAVFQVDDRGCVMLGTEPTPCEEDLVPGNPRFTRAEFAVAVTAKASLPPEDGPRTVLCRGCRRPLRDLASRAVGYGPECKDRLPDPVRECEQDMLPGV